MTVNCWEDIECLGDPMKGQKNDARTVENKDNE